MPEKQPEKTLERFAPDILIGIGVALNGYVFHDLGDGRKLVFTRLGDLQKEITDTLSREI